MESTKNKKNVVYIKIKDLSGRWSLSKTKSGILNVKDEWLEKTHTPAQFDYKKFLANSDLPEKKAKEKARKFLRDREAEYDWKALEDSIKTHGIKNPLEVSKRRSTVEDGNHRLGVLKLLYSPNKKVPCVFVMKGLSMEQIKKELKFHQNEINTLEDGIAFQQYADIGKIIKIY